METIGQIEKRQHPATREELIHFYRKYACADTNDFVLATITTTELKRIVFIAAYKEQYDATKNRGRIVKRITAAMGICWSTGFRYAKAYDKTRKQQVK